MSDDICAFCLGGSAEVPPFGSLKDAADLVKPCSTCSMITHRKCLVDWFNSIPALQIQKEYRNDAGDMAHRPADELHGEVPTPDVDNDTDNEPNIVNLSFRSRWFSVLSVSQNDNDRLNAYEPLSDAISVLLSTSCPQCKSKITFKMKQLPLLALNSIVRSSVSDLALYLCVFLGISGAATGIVTMGYVGLARCGISMLDALVPTSLLLPLLGKGAPGPRAASRRPWLLPSGPDSTERTLYMMSQFKFQHVPLLPVMLYRMRCLLISECFFGKSELKWQNWASEILICNYLSSLGDHVLVKQLYANAKRVVLGIANRKLSSRALYTGMLFKNINWWDPAVMVGAMIPARWIYDLAYRFTFNRAYFDLTTTIRPREIANSLPPAEMASLERLESTMAGLRYDLQRKIKTATKTVPGSKTVQLSSCAAKQAKLLRDDTLLKYVKTRLLYWYYRSKACLLHDFSSTLLSKLTALTSITTVLWPFLASDLGNVIYAVVLRRIPFFAKIDPDNVVLLSHLIGMFGVAVVKETFNLFLCQQKANQLSDLTIVHEVPAQTTRQLNEPPTPTFPGAYVANGQ